MRTFSFLLFIALLVGLALTNPDREDLGRFAEETIRSEIAQYVPNIGGLGEYGARLVAPYVAREAEHTDYVFFSFYDLDLTGPSSPGGEYRFLGIAGQFIGLEAASAE